MRTAIWIEDGVTQLVLTPENGFEKGIVSQVEEGKQRVEIYTGQFYDCQGGWTRQRAISPYEFNREQEENSLIMVMKVKPKEKTR